MRSTLCVCVRGRVVCLGQGFGFPTSCVVLGSGGWVLLFLVRVPARRPPGPAHTHTQPRTHLEVSEKNHPSQPNIKRDTPPTTNTEAMARPPTPQPRVAHTLPGSSSGYFPREPNHRHTSTMCEHRNHTTPANYTTEVEDTVPPQTHTQVVYLTLGLAVLVSLAGLAGWG